MFSTQISGDRQRTSNFRVQNLRIVRPATGPEPVTRVLFRNESVSPKPRLITPISIQSDPAGNR